MKKKSKFGYLLLISGFIVIVVLSLIFITLYPGKTRSLSYYENPEKYQTELKEICNKYGGEEPIDGFEVFELECRAAEICKDMKPIEEFRNFCNKIDGQSRCYSDVWFVCVPPPNSTDEFTICRWDLWEATSCEEIRKYENKQCETDEECGDFPCFEGNCLIRRCEEGCMNYYCASGTAHPHGYCVRFPGDE